MIWTCLDVQSLRSYYLSIFHWRRPSSNRHDACSMMMQLAANPSDLSKMMRISGLTRRQINHFAHYLPRQAGVGLLLTSVQGSGSRFKPREKESVADYEKRGFFLSSFEYTNNQVSQLILEEKKSFENHVGFHFFRIVTI